MRKYKVILALGLSAALLTGCGRIDSPAKVEKEKETANDTAAADSASVTAAPASVTPSPSPTSAAVPIKPARAEDGATSQNSTAMSSENSTPASDSSPDSNPSDTPEKQNNDAGETSHIWQYLPGRIVDIEGNTVYIDTGIDAGITNIKAYDISNAEITIPGGIEIGMDVFVEYYNENGTNTADCISPDNVGNDNEDSGQQDSDNEESGQQDSDSNDMGDYAEESGEE